MTMIAYYIHGVPREPCVLSGKNAGYNNLMRSSNDVTFSDEKQQMTRLSSNDLMLQLLLQKISFCPTLHYMPLFIDWVVFANSRLYTR